MSAEARQDVSTCLLIYAPADRDARLTEEVLGRAGVPCRTCQSLRELCTAFEENGAGAILLFEEAIGDAQFGDLVGTLERQPTWSDIAVLLFAGSGGREAPMTIVRSIDALRRRFQRAA